MKIKRILILTILLSACDSDPSKRDSNPLHLPPSGFVADPIKGQLLFNQSCQSCHGTNGRGTIQGPPLVDKTYEPKHHANLAFNFAVKNGVRSHHWKFGDMPAVPEISPEMIGHITQYIRTLQKQAGIQ